MANALVGATVQILLEKLLSLATENIGLVLGFKKDVETLRGSIEMIQAFLADAEEQKLTKRAVNLWLKNLEGVAYEADNVFDELNYEVLRRKVQIQNQPMKEKVCFFFSFCHTNIAFRWRIASKIRDINLNLKKINDEANSLGLQSQLVASAANTVDRTGPIASRETDSIVGRNVVGRANDASKIVVLLLSPSAEVVSFLPIIGMGGLGKTTLAKLVYNDKEIEKHFDKRIWVCVSDKSFDATWIFKLILESLTESKVDLTARDAIVQKIKNVLAGKRYFLVLDDVWEEDPQLWSDFLDSLNGISTNQGNWSIVTTRKVQVSSNLPACHPLRLEKLADDDCWSIVEKKAISSGGELPTEMKEIREKVATLCQGLPLAASVIGGLLRFKAKEKWLSIIDGELSNVRGDGNDVMQILKMSFDHLPSSSIKKCFAYCSLFSKDTDIGKDQLIQIWMAEGFLQPNLDSRKMMEEIGDDYLDILLQSSLLQEVRDDEDGSEISIRMHDLVHDLAQLVSKSEMINLQNGVRDGNSRARYIVADQFDDGTDTVLKEVSSSLRTLFVKGGTYDGNLLNLKSLHTLNLSGTKTKELPTSIDKLPHLRYLDVSNSYISALPESLCKLYHLQTLRIDECNYLLELPRRMSNLISLRHLHSFGINHDIVMPTGIGKLTCLQTLQFFNISCEKGGQIKELGSLKSLRGQIMIYKLHLVNGKADAQCADLAGKPYLSWLELTWGRDGQGSNQEDVLEGLQPHPNLQALKITNFMGSYFASWLMNIASYKDPKSGLSTGGFNKLVRLTLENCQRCKEIPALGHLPLLEHLILDGLGNVTCIGPSFYGTTEAETDVCNASGFGSRQHIKKIFPTLKSLVLRDMDNLIEWRGAEETTLSTEQGVFPKLEKLTIQGCNKLTTAPSQFPSLKHLIIRGAHVLLPETNICSKVTTLVSLQVRRAKGFKCFGDVVFSNNTNLLYVSLIECPDLAYVQGCSTSLQNLKIQDCGNLSFSAEDLLKFRSLEEFRILECPNLKSIQIPIPTSNSNGQHLHRLRKLEIHDCKGLISISRGECELIDREGLINARGGECELAESSSSTIINNTSSLERIELSECPSLEYIALDTEHVPSLSSLGLCKCPKLMTMPKLSGSLRELRIGPLSKEFGDWRPLSSLSSLSKLNFWGWPNWESLPHQLQYLTSLTELTLHDFGIEALPDWFGNFVSLKTLGLYDCMKLRCLPSRAAMNRLAKLKHFEVYKCPLLEKRCTPTPSSSDPNDSEWSKIYRIPKIIIDFKAVQRS